MEDSSNRPASPPVEETVGRSKGKSRAIVTVQEVGEDDDDPELEMARAEETRMVLAMEISRLESLAMTANMEVEGSSTRPQDEVSRLTDVNASV